ncbi:MAG: winged helix-turn-helix domain-containing protein, partial [Acidimicrobiia bacterium]|nr:winged helix-turn-helix domain-containing protein [Acidimicrobiia bacterium]
MAKSARNLDAPGDSELIRTEFCLLGPVSAWVGGVAVPVGGPRQAAVLARMLLTPRQVVSLDQFIDCIWDGQIPNRPEVAIRSYVSNLRRLLEPERKDRGTNSALASASAGYRLDVDSGQIDWIRYEGSVNEARGQLKSGLFDQAESSLRFAEDLWRGEPLTGVPESEFFLAHRNRLEELRAVAQELTYEAKLALGDHLSVAADIDQAISANPFRERLTELGMIALYRSGRQSAALALGQQLRERLVDSLGIDPSPHINNIELQILTHDPALREQPAPPPRSPSTGAAHPSPVEVTDPGSTNGPRPPSEPTHEIATAERSPLLRRPGDDQLLFGRQGEFGELQRLGQRLDRKLMAVAVVTGEPGVGKTVLLERAAIELAGNGGRIVRCAGTDFAGPKFWLWRQLIDDLVVEPSTPLQSPAISDTTGLEPLQA